MCYGKTNILKLFWNLILDCSKNDQITPVTYRVGKYQIENYWIVYYKVLTNMGFVGF